MRALILTLSFITLALPQQAMAFECWTNRDGVQECGDSVPPEYSQQETRTVNKRGITTETKARAKTKEELAEEKRVKEEQARLMKLEDARKKQQAAYDRMLIMIYTTEDEIIAFRDRKLNVIDGIVELSNVTIDSLQGKLADNQKRAANLERSGEELPDSLLTEIDSLKRQIAEKKAYIITQHREAKELRKQFDNDLKRYREITADRK